MRASTRNVLAMSWASLFHDDVVRLREVNGLSALLQRTLIIRLLRFEQFLEITTTKNVSRSQIGAQSPNHHRCVRRR